MSPQEVVGEEVMGEEIVDDKEIEEVKAPEEVMAVEADRDVEMTG